MPNEDDNSRSAATPGSAATSLSYRDSGVDIDAGNTLVERIKPMVASTRRAGADGAIGGFGGVFDLKAAGYEDPLLIAATDGIGTKLKIAIETGRYDTIGIDLVAMCVNDLVVQGAEPLFFLDYFATGKLDVTAAAEVVSGIAEGCRQSGCALIGGETAEMPGLYKAGDFDAAGFCVGAVERDQLLPRADLASGDILIGLPSSGVHSNGFSLVRKLVEKAGLAWDAPAPWDAAHSLGEALLEPTRIYVKLLLGALKSTGAGQGEGKRASDQHAIKALAHITGGGLSENVPRVLPERLAARIDLGAWEPPKVFDWLCATGSIEEAEMLRTFNCGIGMVLVCDAEAAPGVLEYLAKSGERAVVLGELVARDGGAGVVYDARLWGRQK